MTEVFSDLPPVRVVTGVIRGHSGRVLLTQRTGDRDFPFRWESPGGKVELHETDLQALRRELREEICFDGWIKPTPFLIAGYDPPVVKRACSITYYFCTAPSGWQPTLREVVGAGWFYPREMDQLLLIPGNVAVLRYLQLLEVGGRIP